MRIQLTLDHASDAALPIDYRYILSAWLYHTLENGNPEFSAWLHEQGYNFRGKQYKLFTYGQLHPARYRIGENKQTFILAQPPTRLILSFGMEAGVQNLLLGLFQQHTFSLGDARRRVDFRVREARLLPSPEIGDRLRLSFITPVCISFDDPGAAQTQYLSPADPGYTERFFGNLWRKAYAYRRQVPNTLELPAEADADCSLRLLSEPRPRLHAIRDIKVRGYTFDCELHGPADLLRLGYYAGFGEKTAGLGYGMGKLLAEK